MLVSHQYEFSSDLVYLAQYSRFSEAPLLSIQESEEKSAEQMLFFYTVLEEVCVFVHLQCSVKLLKTAV